MKNNCRQHGLWRQAGVTWFAEFRTRACVRLGLTGLRPANPPERKAPKRCRQWQGNTVRNDKTSKYWIYEQWQDLLSRKSRAKNIRMRKFELKRSYLVVQVAIILSICFSVVSCNTEDRPIKKALKEYALQEGTKYKLDRYQISETILKSNLEDSIRKHNTSIEVQKQIMSTDSLLLNNYIAQREQCKKQQKDAPYYLASSYNSLIRDWQRMADEQEEKLSERQSKIDDFNADIEKWKSLISYTETPIVYYVIKAFYTLDGKYCEKTILLNTEYKPL